MRHLWLIFAVGCGGISGEDLKGDVSIAYGSSSPDLVVGAAVQDENTPGEMLVQLGSDNVDCDTYLDRFFDFDLPKGTFVYFSVTKDASAHPQSSVSTMKHSGNSISVNSSTGSVTITAVEPRVTGSVMFTTNDEDVGTISVMGTFDVVRCF